MKRLIEKCIYDASEILFEIICYPNRKNGILKARIEEQIILEGFKRLKRKNQLPLDACRDSYKILLLSYNIYVVTRTMK